MGYSVTGLFAKEEGKRLSVDFREVFEFDDVDPPFAVSVINIGPPLNHWTSL
jgi:hypothetical protein